MAGEAAAAMAAAVSIAPTTTLPKRAAAAAAGIPETAMEQCKEMERQDGVAPLWVSH